MKVSTVFVICVSLSFFNLCSIIISVLCMWCHFQYRAFSVNGWKLLYFTHLISWNFKGAIILNHLKSVSDRLSLFNLSTSNNFIELNLNSSIFLFFSCFIIFIFFFLFPSIIIVKLFIPYLTCITWCHILSTSHILTKQVATVFFFSVLSSYDFSNEYAKCLP